MEIFKGILAEAAEQSQRSEGQNDQKNEVTKKQGMVVTVIYMPITSPLNSV